MSRTTTGFQIAARIFKVGFVAIITFLSSCKPVEQELKVKVETGTVTDVGHAFAVIEGKIVDAGEGKIDQHGFCYGVSENPTIFNDNTQLGQRTSAGSFTDSLLNLQSATIYYVCAYAQAAEEIFYGDQATFTTQSPTSPVVAIDSVGEFENDSVKVVSTVTDDGGSEVTARGVCWGLNQNPTLSDEFTNNGSGTGSFTSYITGLAPDTTYYFRAYATSGAGTSYSDQHQVSTPPGSVSISTEAITGITMNSAVSGGNITNDGGSEITVRGVCWSAAENPTISDSKTTDGTGTGSFTSSISGLSPGTTYYVRAYATNSSGTFYGDELSFSTTSQSASLPVLTTSAASSITESSAVSGGDITDDGGSSVIARGVCWSTSHNPDLSNGFTADGTGTGIFTSSITGLSPNTTYYVRAYATNGEGTSYGSEEGFTTDQALYLPTLTTTSVTSITESSAVSGGNITDDGGSAITTRGVCWSTSTGPDLTGDHTTDGTGTGSFTSSITGLSTDTTYYVRAYATNGEGTSFGNEVSFNTGQSSSLPTITTSGATSITETSAESGGNVTDDGGSSIIARGVCWSTSHNPDLTDSNTTDGTGTGGFASSITGLTSNTTYYIRAYATNGEGTSFGNEVSFTTNASVFLPTLTTATATSITENSAVSGGNITDNGGSSVIARGVCWSTFAGPDLVGDHTTDGSGTGSYTSSITGLSPNTTYYVRAYATNGQGTAYGNEVSFTTNSSPSLPTLTTTSVSNIATNSAKSGGNITDDGGSSIIARGACWSISQNPDLFGDYTTDGGGTGSFISTMIGLSPNTAYYVRAYATNNTGTAYGNEVSFTTADLGETVTDIDGNVYQTVVIGTQTWMAENLKAIHYANGDAIPQNSDVLDWVGTTEGAYCYYDNDYVTYGETYGPLYNYYAVVDVRNICPSGWHTPSHDEWTILVDIAGGEDVAGAKLSENGGIHWPESHYGTDEYGFTGLPGGGREHDGYFRWQGGRAIWWTNKIDPYNGVSMQIDGFGFRIVGISSNHSFGYSVRCLKD